MAGQLLVAQPHGCGARLRRTTAIPAQFLEDAEGEVASATLTLSLGAVAIAALAVAPAVLPALVASGPAPLGLTFVAAAGFLVAVLGGGKVALVAWLRAASAQFD
jgi:hypothetical protein